MVAVHGLVLDYLPTTALPSSDYVEALEAGSMTEETPAPAFKVGDVVRLKSGGFPMTVVRGNQVMTDEQLNDYAESLAKSTFAPFRHPLDLTVVWHDQAGI